jgi:hypothetical protein
MMTWLSKLDPDKVGKPYVSARAHRSFWEAVERLARNAQIQINGDMLEGDMMAAREITKHNLVEIENIRQQFIKNYNLEEV